MRYPGWILLAIILVSSNIVSAQQMGGMPYNAFDQFDGEHVEIYMVGGGYFNGTLRCERFDDAKIPELLGNVCGLTIELNDGKVAAFSQYYVMWIREN